MENQGGEPGWRTKEENQGGEPRRRTRVEKQERPQIKTKCPSVFLEQSLLKHLKVNVCMKYIFSAEDTEHSHIHLSAALSVRRAVQDSVSWEDWDRTFWLEDNRFTPATAKPKSVIRFHTEGVKGQRLIYTSSTDCK